MTQAAAPSENWTSVSASVPFRLTAAITQAYAAAEKISFEKLHKRTDIGFRALKAIAEKE